MRYEYARLTRRKVSGMSYYYLDGIEISSNLLTVLNEIGGDGWHVAFKETDNLFYVQRLIKS